MRTDLKNLYMSCLPGGRQARTFQSGIFLRDSRLTFRFLDSAIQAGFLRAVHLLLESDFVNSHSKVLLRLDLDLE